MQTPPMHNVKKPQSATSNSTGFIGLAGLALALYATHDLSIIPTYKTLIALGACAGLMILWEIIVLKTHLRESTGLDWTLRNYNLKRSAIKMLGLVITVGLLAALYIVFPEYDLPKYKPAWDAAFLLLPSLIPLAAIYIIMIDGMMKTPEDGYYQIGLIGIGQYHHADKAKIAPHIRSWLIKGFFTPLMFIFIARNVGNIPANVEGLSIALETMNIVKLSMIAMFILFSIDLAFGVCGYVVSSRVIDTHERSSEPTFLGWFVALMCYPPFWQMFDKFYFNKGPTPEWDTIAQQFPVFSLLWAVTLIICLAVYSWATMAFGLRFSNLTHRGIITSGPYSLTKHPAYISKNLSWWMMSAPFITMMDKPFPAVQTCIALLMINGIYYLRAKTEERHLSQDQTYRDYAAWIDRHGIFRWVRLKQL